MTGAIHGIKLRRLWGKFNDNIYPPICRHCGDDCMQHVTVERLRQELEEWHASTPGPVDHSGSKPLSVFASSEWFQLAYDHSILLLYRHYIASPAERHENESGTSTSTNEKVERAFEECALRAREMCLLYRRLYQSSSIQFTWGSLHILFLGGLTYLYCLWRSRRVRDMTKQSDVVSTCMACTTVLIIIAERWKQATSYRDIFEALSERTIRMICGNGTVPRLSDYPPLGLGPEFWDQNVSDVPIQDWIIGMDDMAMPQESEWLVQELLQEFQ
jgi:hypothetical protein